jgi:hypothetical protein
MYSGEPLSANFKNPPTHRPVERAYDTSKSETVALSGHSGDAYSLERPTLLRYAILHMFGLVHAVLLTLLSFALSTWSASWGLLGCSLLPVLSFALGIGCAWWTLYVCEGSATMREAIRRGWTPALGVLCAGLFLLPLEVLKSAGPTVLVSTSIVVNAIVAWILQVYSLHSSSSELSADRTSSVGSGPT